MTNPAGYSSIQSTITAAIIPSMSTFNVSSLLNHSIMNTATSNVAHSSVVVNGTVSYSTMTQYLSVSVEQEVIRPTIIEPMASTR